MSEVSTRPRKGATTVTAAATAVAAVPTEASTDQRTGFDAYCHVDDSRRVSALTQWIEAARLVCDKVEFFKRNSPEFAAQCEAYGINTPGWDDEESEALVIIMRDQTDKLHAVLQHMEGGAA